MNKINCLTFFCAFFKWLFVFFCTSGISGISYSEVTTVRKITLFPRDDVSLIETEEPRDALKNNRIQVALTHLLVNMKNVPCFSQVDFLPLYYSYLEFGISCALETNPQSAVAFEFFPLINILNSRKQNGIALGFAHSYTLIPGPEKTLFVANMFYRLVSAENVDYKEQFDSRSLLQLWSYALDSNIKLGVIQYLSERSALFWQYKQTLPLSLRKFPYQNNSASLEYRYLGLSYRKRINIISWGASLGLGILSLDHFKYYLPVPELYVSATF